MINWIISTVVNSIFKDTGVVITPGIKCLKEVGGNSVTGDREKEIPIQDTPQEGSLSLTLISLDFFFFCHLVV